MFLLNVLLQEFLAVEFQGRYRAAVGIGGGSRLLLLLVVVRLHLDVLVEVRFVYQIPPGRKRDVVRLQLQMTISIL